MTAESMDIAPITDIADVADRWRDGPHSVLLATGAAFDVVEVPEYIGAPAWGRLRGPVAVTPQGQWMFLVRPGETLHPHLAGHRDVVLHGVGSWIPVPPVRTPQGTIRWIVTPQEAQWRLPDAGELQGVLVGTLPAPPDRTSDHLAV